MTDVKMVLVQLLEKGSDADLLREMVGYVAQRLMELDVESLCGAAHSERSGERENWRNGYRDRARETRAGTREPYRCAFGSCAATATFRGF
jgi:transposase-like protein